MEDRTEVIADTIVAALPGVSKRVASTAFNTFNRRTSSAGSATGARRLTPLRSRNSTRPARRSRNKCRGMTNRVARPGTNAGAPAGRNGDAETQVASILVRLSKRPLWRGEVLPVSSLRKGAAAMTDLADAKLEPCPFCGEPAKMQVSRVAEDAEMAVVECTGCLAATTVYEDAYAPVEQAIAAWNRRHASPPGEVAEVVKQLSEDWQTKIQVLELGDDYDALLRLISAAKDAATLLESLSLSRQSAVNEGLRMAAEVVEQHQQTFTNGDEGRHLTKRTDGNLDGMAYAAAILALQEPKP